MPQNLANIQFTSAEIVTLTGALESIRTVMGDRAVSLSPEQRKTLVKMGGSTRVFCQQAVAGINANSGSMPPDLDIPGLVQDLADYTTLETFYADYQATGELIEDTLKALSSDVMTNSIIGVSFLKALNKLNPALDSLLASLKLVRRRRPTKATPPPSA